VVGEGNGRFLCELLRLHPEVVVRIGFWSCVTINDTCSFTSGGATKHCTCSRTDGEGQSPTWICQ